MFKTQIQYNIMVLSITLWVFSCSFMGSKMKMVIINKIFQQMNQFIMQWSFMGNEKENNEPWKQDAKVISAKMYHI